MNHRHSNPYKDRAISLTAKFNNWSCSRYSVKLKVEAEYLRSLSFEAFKLAKQLEDAEEKPTTVLSLFDDCRTKGHEVTIWELTGYTTVDRNPIRRGECNKCSAEVTDYGT